MTTYDPLVPTFDQDNKGFFVMFKNQRVDFPFRSEFAVALCKIWLDDEYYAYGVCRMAKNLSPKRIKRFIDYIFDHCFSNSPSTWKVKRNFKGETFLICWHGNHQTSFKVSDRALIDNFLEVTNTVFVCDGKHLNIKYFLEFLRLSEIARHNYWPKASRN